jgi:RsiW-degrading membrane proteinase PrsW (M82 family)
MQTITTGQNYPIHTGRRRPWLRVFLVGLALWAAAVVVTFITQNPNLVPTVVLLGSFLIPVTFVTWAFERRDTGELTATLVFNTFLTGGVLGVLGASVLEAYLLRPSWWLFAGVGLIEEAVKLAALALLTRHLATKSVRDGIILGAAVGFGFAAFESAGYAFTALFTVNGLSLIQVVQTEILRGILTPPRARPLDRNSGRRPVLRLDPPPLRDNRATHPRVSRRLSAPRALGRDA